MCFAIQLSSENKARISVCFCRFLVAGWLEPLLTPIHKNATVVTAPSIDTISYETFAYQRSVAAQVGGFSWKLSFCWHDLPERIKARRKSPMDPIPYEYINADIYNRAVYVNVTSRECLSARFRAGGFGRF